MEQARMDHVTTATRIVKNLSMTKPPGWIMCPFCHGTTYLFERVDDEKSRMLFVKCTNPKCREGFISFDEL